MKMRVLVVSILFVCILYQLTTNVIAQPSGELEELRTELDQLNNQKEYAEDISIAEKKCFLTEKIYGPDHEVTATALNNLAGLYLKMGRYAEAETRCKTSLEIREARFGTDAPWVANSLNTLASIYRQTDRYFEAERMWKRALAIVNKAYGKDDSIGAIVQDNLGELYYTEGRYEEAEPLFKDSLRIREMNPGKDPLDVAKSLNFLAMINYANGRYPEAEDLLMECLKIREMKLGKNHLDVSESYNNLAIVYLIRGRYGEAEPLFKESLRIREINLGKDHPSVADSLINLVVIYNASERYSLSRQYLSKAIKIREQTMENAFLLLDETQQLHYMAKINDLINLMFSLTLQQPQGKTWVVEDIFNAWVRWKGAVTEVQGHIKTVCFRTEDPLIKNKCDELDNIRRILARYGRTNPGAIDTGTYLNPLVEYKQMQRSLESELSQLRVDIRQENFMNKGDMKSISNFLPMDSVYLDFAEITPYDFKNRKFEEKSHFLVFVLTPGDRPRVALVDLGHSDVINDNIWKYHEIIQDAISHSRPPDIDALRQCLRVLHRLVVEPLALHLQGKKKFFVSPERGLNFIPFEAFVTSTGQYLIQEGVTINYVATGRDIMRFNDNTKAHGSALILADPDYDLEEKDRMEVTKRLGLSELVSMGPASPYVPRPSFPRLPNTRIQARKIEEIIKKKGHVTSYLDNEAIEEVLFAASSPRVLHIATHGYFLPSTKSIKITPKFDAGLNAQKTSNAPKEYYVDPIRYPGVSVSYHLLREDDYENPMRFSGIALAGANTAQLRIEDYGIVSAEKIVGLKLKGTDLVVLSACNTGQGMVLKGEGVFGLKRAFILSGAKTVVMSLWSVPSDETTELMVSFYTKWSSGRSKADALREAKVAIMMKNPNPFFWAGFVMVGDPGK